MSSLDESRMQASAQVRRALEKIEDAQVILGEACGLLSRVVGASDQWTEVGNLYDTVKATWHSVNSATAAKKDLKMDSLW